jgi:hypothetical protein
VFSILSMAPGPYQWEHYSVTLILPFLVLLAEALRPPHDRGMAVRFALIAACLLVVFAMLDLDLRERIRLDKSANQLARSWTAIAHVIFYDVTTWLPWFILATAMSVRLALPGREPHDVLGSRSEVPHLSGIAAGDIAIDG